MNKKLLLDNLRNVPNFPKTGIQFKDVQSLFEKPECLHEITDELVKIYKDRGITKVVAIESRGFVAGAILAERIGAGFIMCRKAGKLPGKVKSTTYMKEYGPDTIQMQADAIASDDVVLIHDDLLATGGSMRAAYDLVKEYNPRKILVNFILELKGEGLTGREVFPDETEVVSLLQIDN